MRHIAIRWMIIAAAAILLQACKAELYSNLGEREANMMVATLLANGISASRTVQKDGKLTVTVEKSQFAQAVNILSEAGLPKEQFATIGSVFKQEGLVASPVQERAQMIYALSEELSRTVSEIDGVLSARVHVVLPGNDPLQRNAVPASASVFIRHEPNLDINALIPQIKTLVANGIAGLTYEKVSVVPVAAPPSRLSAPAPAKLTPFLGVWMLDASVSRAMWIFGGLVAIILALGGTLAFTFWRDRGRKTYQLEPISSNK
ncbi:type III secretion system inner membrane ring lipoprotein SctJ [Phyllobacterium salinisoli]|uniref:type III secretion system inner membrane ring lipoprotein SctJ n=1 Tax=Phyllobacterium salinisoli TaxID=1899321 RepID=UPI001FE03C26|nr:type III secretion inner membrane ring lipoprotein SctJ [Phyllobacterium salinisoli]